jgi:hypothetical protein
MAYVDLLLGHEVGGKRHVVLVVVLSPRCSQGVPPKWHGTTAAHEQVADGRAQQTWREHPPASWVLQGALGAACAPWQQPARSKCRVFQAW